MTNNNIPNSLNNNNNIPNSLNNNNNIPNSLNNEIIMTNNNIPNSLNNEIISMTKQEMVNNVLNTNDKKKHIINESFINIEPFDNMSSLFSRF